MDDAEFLPIKPEDVPPEINKLAILYSMASKWSEKAHLSSYYGRGLSKKADLNHSDLERVIQEVSGCLTATSKAQQFMEQFLHQADIDYQRLIAKELFDEVMNEQKR